MTAPDAVSTTRWPLVSLGEVASLVSGGTPSKSRPEWWVGTLPWASPKDLKVARLGDTEDHITEEAAREGSRIVPAGTILIVIRGMILAKDVPLALTTRPMAFNQDLKAIVPGDQVDPEFLLFALQAGKDQRHRLLGSSAHGTKSILTSVIAGLQIPLPPLAEQQAIARALRTVQVAKDARRRELELERERRAALVVDLFRDGTRGEKRCDTPLGPLPSSWQVVRLDDVVTARKGQVDPRLSPFREMLHIGPEDIEEGTGRVLSPRPAGELGLISGKYPFDDSDVLYSKIRPYLKKVALPELSGVCSADMYPLRPRDARLRRDFLYCYLLTDLFTDQVIARQDRTGIPKVNRNELFSTFLPCPDGEEQVTISEAIIAAERKTRALIVESERLDELFRALLEELMSGRLPSVPLVEATDGETPT